METPSLKTCPFCGGEVTVGRQPKFHADEDDIFVIHCTRCRAAMSKGSPTPEDAIDAWNVRTS